MYIYNIYDIIYNYIYIYIYVTDNEKVAHV